MSETPPRVIAYRYLLLGLLGQGGMGRVWAARDQLLNRDVAVKELVPPPGLTADELRDLRERVMREARAPAPTAPKPSVAKSTATVTTPTTETSTNGGETPDVAAGKPFINMMTGTCLDVPDGATTTSDLELWACQVVGNQSFAFASDGTLRALGKCLQIGDTGNGAHLRMTTCTGSAAQRFTYNSAYDLVSIKAGKCVDVPDGSSANGITAQIWECTGAGNQKWHY